jgi:hypothetical protein
MNITLTHHQQHGPRNSMGDITTRAQCDAGFAPYSAAMHDLASGPMVLRKISSWASVGLLRSS